MHDEATRRRDVLEQAHQRLLDEHQRLLDEHDRLLAEHERLRDAGRDWRRRMHDASATSSARWMWNRKQRAWGQ